MKFRYKIILAFTVFSMAVMAFFMYSYFFITREKAMARECENVELLSEQAYRQYEETIKFMETAYRYLVKDIDVLEAFRQLSRLPDGIDYVNFYFSNATMEVQKALYSDYVFSNFFQVIYFNQRGVVLTSSLDNNNTVSDFDITSFDWLDKVDQVPYGQLFVRGVHKDDWGKTNENVFSIVKSIQGNNRGYIEVQRSLDDLNHIFGVTENDTKVLILDAQMNVLYSSQPSNADRGYKSFVAQKTLSGIEFINEVTGEREYVAGHRSADGVVLLAINSDENITQQLRYTFIMILAFAAIFIGIAFIYITVSSKQLAKPVDELKQLMVLTELDPARGEVRLKTEGDEFGLIRENYQNVLNKLNMSLEREKKISLSQLQAQFDALHAQVNPHFIYNVLNVISGRGFSGGDEVICDICDDLARILRYSTDTRHRYATIGEEGDYLESYLNLLKNRYGRKLEYKIEIDPKIKSLMIPKLVLQQFAENSIQYGFEHPRDVMRVDVCGWHDEQGWRISIQDNGGGFSEDALTDICSRMKTLKKQILEDNQNIELNIGGMGITNTYTRLLLLYETKLFFSIENKNGGAEILFGENRRLIDV